MANVMILKHFYTRRENKVRPYTNKLQYTCKLGDFKNIFALNWDIDCLKENYGNKL